MSQIKREIINNSIVGLFQCTRHMYQTAFAKARRERDVQLFNDWSEWAALDEESKQYVRNFLSKQERE